MYYEQLFSYSGLSKLFGRSDKSIKEYLEAFAKAHLIYEVDLFSYSLKKQMQSPKKVYSIDTGQSNAMGFRFSANLGRLLENLIFIDLKRLNLDVYYFRSAADYEVDFVIKDGVDLGLIQVVWDLNSSEIRKRELRALQEAMNELECKTGAVIVAEEALSMEPGMENIIIIPAYKYLMMNDTQQKELFLRKN